MRASTQQTAPVRTASSEVWPEVFNNVNLVLPEWLAADMRERHEFGVKKYGVGLQVWNGRDSVVDAYQEALDAIVYTHQSKRRYLEAGIDDPNTRLALDLCFHHSLQLARWLGELAQKKRIPTEPKK